MASNGNGSAAKSLPIVCEPISPAIRTMLQSAEFAALAPGGELTLADGRVITRLGGDAYAELEPDNSGPVPAASDGDDA